MPGPSAGHREGVPRQRREWIDDSESSRRTSPEDRRSTSSVVGDLPTSGSRRSALGLLRFGQTRVDCRGPEVVLADFEDHSVSSLHALETHRNVHVHAQPVAAFVFDLCEAVVLALDEMDHCAFAFLSEGNRARGKRALPFLKGFRRNEVYAASGTQVPASDQESPVKVERRSVCFCADEASTNVSAPAGNYSVRLVSPRPSVYLGSRRLRTQESGCLGRYLRFHTVALLGPLNLVVLHGRREPL